MRTAMDAPVKAGQPTAETARVIEELGYRSLWLGGVTADLNVPEQLSAATTTLTVASGVANIWTCPLHGPHGGDLTQVVRGA